MTTQIIPTNDEDIIIERNYTDISISKRELRRQKQSLREELKMWNDKIDLYRKYNIDDEIKYLLDIEIDNYKMQRDVIRNRIDDINIILNEE
jgi:hypothetical protein